MTARHLPLRVAWERSLLVFMMFLGLYLVTAPGHMWNTDGWTRYAIAVNLAERGKPSIPAENIGTLGEYWTVRGADGDYYSFYGLGQSLAYVPLYWASKWITSMTGDLGMASLEQFSASFLNTLVGALLAVAVFHLALNLGYRPMTALGVTALVGVGTIVWAHTRDNYDLMLETLWVICAFAVLVRSGSESNNAFRLITAGALAGLGLVARASTLLAFPGFALLIVGGPHGFSLEWKHPKQWRAGGRDLSLFALGLLPGMVFNLWYNYVRFGSWLTTGYEQKSPIWFGNSILLGLADFLVSPGRGVLLYAPVVLVSPFLFKRFWKRAPVFALAVVVTSATYLLVYSQFGGLGLWAWGPHYLLPVIPLLVLPWGETVEGWSLLSRQRRAFLLVLVGVSLGVQFLSASAAYLRTYIWASVEGVEYDRTYDWRVEWSPLLLQGANLAHSLDNMAARRQYEFITTIQSREYLLEHDITLNVLDWWWVLAMYRGIRWAWLVPLAALATSGAAFCMFRQARRWRGQPGSG